LIDERLSEQNEPNDAFFVKGTLKGNKDAFGTLVRRYNRRLLGFLHRRVGHFEAVGDIAQEVWLRAYNGLSTCEKQDRFWDWVLGIARNCIRKWIEKSRGSRVQVSSSLDDLSKEDDTWLQERLAMLESVLSSLPADIKNVVIMKFHREMSCAEIAASLKMPLNSVTKMLSRAYERLRVLMELKERE
jgi:RNA polymerase sigma-70 factor (ECF subfamily)